MKLRKIKEIKKYKSFENFNWKDLKVNDFRDVNVVFGENGSGKSSIVSVLRSISNYKDLSTRSDTEISLIFDNSNERKYLNGSWGEKIGKEKFQFFDQEFIRKNIHLSQSRGMRDSEPGQESAKLIVEFDSHAIELRKERDQIRIQRNKERAKLREYKIESQKAISFTLDDNEYGLYDKYKNRDIYSIELVKNEIREELDKLKEELKRDNDLQGKATRIAAIEPLKTDSYGLSLSDQSIYQGIFNFKLNISADISDQELLEKIKKYRKFFDMGISVMEDYPGKCPFCQSSDTHTKAQGTIEIFNQVFDSSFKEREERFEATKEAQVRELNKIIQTLDNIDLRAVFLELKELEATYFIPNLYQIQEERPHTKPDISQLENFRNKILNLIIPTNEDIGTIYIQVRNAFHAVENFMNNHKWFIDRKNAYIDSFKRNNNTEEVIQSRIQKNNARLRELGSELTFLESGKIAQQKDKEVVLGEIRLLETSCSNLNSKYQSTLKGYDAYCNSGIFRSMLKAIETYFRCFDFDFKLVQNIRSTGARNELPFSFAIFDACGNERSFEEGLSEGEIQVLSLCFFFAFLDIQGSKGEKILVFDDPVTSLDSSNLHRLIELILKECENYSQVFILTHSNTFHKLVRKQVDSINMPCNKYNLLRNPRELGGTFISNAEKGNFLKELRNYVDDNRVIANNDSDANLEVIRYGQYLRYEVEEFIVDQILFQRSNKLSLTIDGIIRNKIIDDEDLREIQKIYALCNWTTAHVDMAVDYGEVFLKEQIHKFLRIYEKYRSHLGLKKIA